MDTIKHLIFDADDTLWENNIYYENARHNFFKLCEKYGISKNEAEQQFNQTEIRLVSEKGYGTTNFLLILDTLFKLLLPAEACDQFNRLQEAFKKTVYRPRKTFPDVEKTLAGLKKKYNLFVLTKGDLKEQKSKLDNSGLNHFFSDRFIVSEKDDQTYLSILTEKKWQSTEVCMIGNSPKSDINPALNAGMWAIYIPYAHTWFLEDEPLKIDHEKFIRIAQFSDLGQVFTV
jgi:putative hydrolase of the HAD superfamily